MPETDAPETECAEILARFRQAVSKGRQGEPLRNPGTRGSASFGAAQTVLFDGSFYASQLPWFARDSVDPLEHYLTTGWRLGLTPHIAFDSAHVASQMGIPSWSEPPLLAYFEHDEEVSAHPLFDVNIYARYVDIAALPFSRLFEAFLDWSPAARAPFSRLFGTAFYGRWELVARLGTINPLLHYLTTDLVRRSDPNPMFHGRWYDLHHPATPGLPADPLIRYAVIGLKEGHLPNPFARDELRLLGDDTPVPSEMLQAYVDISEVDFVPTPRSSLLPATANRRANPSRAAELTPEVGSTRFPRAQDQEAETLA